MGVAQAEVLSAGPRRSTIEFVTPDRVTYRPELGVLYPSELADRHADIRRIRQERSESCPSTTSQRLAGDHPGGFDRGGGLARRGRLTDGGDIHRKAIRPLAMPDQSLQPVVAANVDDPVSVELIDRGGGNDLLNVVEPLLVCVVHRDGVDRGITCADPVDQRLRQPRHLGDACEVLVVAGRIGLPEQLVDEVLQFGRRQIGVGCGRQEQGIAHPMGVAGGRRVEEGHRPVRHLQVAAVDVVGDLAAVKHHQPRAVRALGLDVDLERERSGRPAEPDAESVVGQRHAGGRVRARRCDRDTVDGVRAAGAGEHDTDHGGHPQPAHIAEPMPGEMPGRRNSSPLRYFSRAPTS